VGLLECTGLDKTLGACTRSTDNRLARSAGLSPGGIAQRLQTLLIGEGSECHLALGLGLTIGVAGYQHALIINFQTGQLTSGEAVLVHCSHCKSSGVLRRAFKIQKEPCRRNSSIRLPG